MKTITPFNSLFLRPESLKHLLRARLLMSQALVLVLVFSILPQPALGGSRLPPSDTQSLLNGEVVKVKDGDSLVVDVGSNDIEVRLHGIDAPEWHQAYGDHSKQTLTSLVLHKNVSIHSVTTDSYGRTVAVVYLNAQNINVQMVEQGAAWWYRKFAGSDNALKAAEQQARRQKRGLWRLPNPEPPWQWRRNNPRN